MRAVMNFVSVHDVTIGVIGTLIVIVGLITGYGRRHRRDTPDDSRR